MNNKIKVVLVDTHENVRNCFRNVIEKERDIEVVAEVKDVTLYIQHADMLKPDVFVLNMNLSGINIYHTISYIIALIPDTKVLVVSFLFRQPIRIEDVICGSFRLYAQGLCL